jgi:hypothetical protein
MTLVTDEFIRRFLLTSCRAASTASATMACSQASSRKASIALARQLLDVAPPPDDADPVEPVDVRPPCPCCGGHMVVIEAFERWQQPRAPPSSPTPVRELAS